MFKPSFALLDQLIAIARGLDLDDDDVVGAALRSRPAAGRSGLEERALGTIEARAGRYGDAADAFARALALDPADDLAAMLEAWTRVRAGDAARALSLLDALAARHIEDASFEPPLPRTEDGGAGAFDIFKNLEKLANGDVDEARAELVLFQQSIAARGRVDRVDRAMLAHARADAHFTLGNLDDAGDAYGYAGSFSKWARLDHARLLAARGRRDEARQLVATISDDDYELREHASPLLAAIELGESLAAAVAVLEERRLMHRESLQQALAREPALRDIVAHERVAAALQPPARADTSWLRAAQPALAALVDDERMRAAGIEPLAQQDARAIGAQLAAHYEGNWHLGVLWTDALFAFCAERARGKVCIARAPALTTSAGALQHRPHLYVDLARPERVFILPAPEFPAALGVEVEARADAVLHALDALVVRRPVPRADLTQRTRAWVGTLRHTAVPNPYTGQLEPASPLALERHFAFSPALQSLLWGSAHDDDPYPARFPPQPDYQTKLNVLTARYRLQREGSPFAAFFRSTHFSRSHVGFELHACHHYVVDVRHRANPFPDVVRCFNEALGTTYPTTLPLDVVAALHGFQWATAGDIDKHLESAPHPSALAAYLDIIAAVGAHAPDAARARMAGYAKHPDPAVRGAVYDVAATYNWPDLLDVLDDDDTDADLRKYIARARAHGFRIPQYNHLGEPVELASHLQPQEH